MSFTFSPLIPIHSSRWTQFKSGLTDALTDSKTGQHWSNVDNRLPEWYGQSDDGISSMNTGDHEVSDDGLFMENDDDQAEDEEPGNQEVQADNGPEGIDDGGDDENDNIDNDNNDQQQPAVAPLAAQAPAAVPLGGHIPNWREIPNLPELNNEQAGHINVLLAQAEQEILAHEATPALTKYWTPGEDSLLLFLRECGFGHNQIAGVSN